MKIKHLIAFLLLVSVSIHLNKAFAQNSDRAKVVPAILALLLIRDDSTPPSFAAQPDTIQLFQGLSTAIVLSNNGGVGLTSCSTVDSLPAGMSLAVSASGENCELVGTPSTLSGDVVINIVAENAVGSDTIAITITVSEPIISGELTYDRVPVIQNRLNYDAIVKQPIRAATVELVNSAGSVVQTTTSSQLGEYAFTVTDLQAYRIRVRAELLKQTGDETYDVKVVDNTNESAIYTLTEANTSSISVNSTRDLHAASGWGGSAYTSTRAAAPFALLDSIYEAILDFVAVDPDIQMSPLTVNWSVNNTTAGGDIAAGQIGTSFYTNSNLFILGAANNDTDEYDTHVVVHEWGHYFEDNLSRSDSIGGRHGGGDLLDLRVAFGEGFGNALSAIVLDEPFYIDTSGVSQNSGFSFSMENNANFNPGWYSEGSVQSILYDLYDDDDDGADSLTMGLAPLYQVLTGDQKTTPALTSIFTFITNLKANNPASVTDIDAIVSAQNIDASSIDAYGSNETNVPGFLNAADILPIYTTIQAGETKNVCTSTPDNAQPVNNRLSNRRFLSFELSGPGNQQFELSATRTSVEPVNYGNSDPDIAVYRQGALIVSGESATVNSEVIPPSELDLEPGDYIIEIIDFSIINPGARGKACFDVTLAPVES